MTVIALSWPLDKGQWVPLAAGRCLAQNHFEMIADESLGLHLQERVRLGRETYTVVGITRGMIDLGGDGISFFTVADAQTIQSQNPNEAIRLERAARYVRGEQSDMGSSNRPSWTLTTAPRSGCPTRRFRRSAP